MRSRATLLLAAVLIAASRATPPPSATDILHAAMGADHRVSYEGEVEVQQIGARHSDLSIYRVEHAANGPTRRWYLAPRAIYGDTVITKGPHSYSIDVKNERVVIGEAGDSEQGIGTEGSFAVLAANYEAVLGPDETLDGRPVRVIALDNRYTGQLTLKLHIDAATHLVLERQQFAADGALISVTRFEQIRYTKAIPQADFEIPSGMRHVAEPARSAESGDVQGVLASAGFVALVPKYLPPGFRPFSGGVSSIKNVPTLHVLYSDGIRTISFFQNEKNAAVDLSRFRAVQTSVANHPARYVEEGPTTLLAWSDGTRHFALVSDLSLDELEKIGASVVP